MRAVAAACKVVMAATLLSLAGSCALAAGACWKVATIAAHVAARPHVPREPRPEPASLVLLHGDLGLVPQEAGLGVRGAPDARVRPPIPLWYWNRHGRRR